MKKLLKRAALAYAVKEVAETVIERRRKRKPSLGARALKLGLVAGVAGAGFYLYKSGALTEVLRQVKGTSPGDFGAKAASDGAPEITYRSEDEPVSAPVG
jgi:hypothetical protein